MEFQPWNQRVSLADDEAEAPPPPGSWHLRLIDELHNLGADGWEVMTFHHAVTPDDSGRGTPGDTLPLVVEFQGVLRRMSPDQVWDYRIERVIETDHERPDLLEVLHVAIDDLWIVCGYALTHRRHAESAPDAAGVEHWFLFKRHRTGG